MNKEIIKNVTLGSDPEVFLYHTDNQEYFSAVGLIKGTKKKPLQMEGLPVGYAWQVDNVALEYNIPACKTLNEWLIAHNNGLEYMRSNIPSELEILVRPSARFLSKYLENKEARTFGCDPDFNVWTRERNIPPDTNTTLRTCGGHISVGYEDPTMENSELIVKTMELFLGLASVVLDGDIERRDMYGKSGAFRFKNFGVEYRVLSNFWLINAEYRAWAFDQTMKAIEFINEHEEISKEASELIPRTINTGDVDIANQIMKAYKIILPENIEQGYAKRKEQTVMY